SAINEFSPGLPPQVEYGGENNLSRYSITSQVPHITPPAREEGGPGSRMNYRHAFHAGNFADVVKHVVLTRILLYLQDKPAAFRVIDTHAGAGLYDLTSAEAVRGGDWLTGIARLLQARFSENVALLVNPYLDIVRAFNPQRDLQAYPGSPLIARALL